MCRQSRHAATWRSRANHPRSRRPGRLRPMARPYPLVECFKLMPDAAVAVLGDAVAAVPDLSACANEKTKVKLHEQMVAREDQPGDRLLGARSWCAQTQWRRAGVRRVSQGVRTVLQRTAGEPAEERLLQGIRAHEAREASARSGQVLTTTPPLPDIVETNYAKLVIQVSAHPSLARVQPQRGCVAAQVTSSRSAVPAHPTPTRGVDSQHGPKMLQVIIRKYICPAGTDAAWVGGRSKALCTAIWFWLERG